MSPAASAVSERLTRFPASAWTLPDSRAPSTALSSSSAASASCPRSNLTCPRIEYASGMNSLCPVARADRHRSFGVGLRLLIAVEVELGAGEVGGGVEAKREFVIVQVRDEGRRLRAMRLGLRGGSVGRAGEREHRDGGRGQRPVAERPCGAQRSLGPLAHPPVVHAEEAVHRELDHQRRRLGRRRVGKAVHRADEPGVRLLVAAEQVLDAGARRREPHPQRDRLGRDEPDALQQRGVPVGELPGRDERPRAGEQQLDPHLGRRRASGRSRSASPNQAAALAGARCAAASPASRRVATAAASPCRAERSTWWARSAAGAPRAASVSALRSCAPSRQPPGVDS